MKNKKTKKSTNVIEKLTKKSKEWIDEDPDIEEIRIIHIKSKSRKITVI